MNRRQLRAATVWFLALLSCLAVRALHAQDDEEDEPDDTSKYATLILRFDEHGAATARLFLSSKPHSVEQLQAAMGQMLGCAGSQFSSPVMRDIERYRKSMGERWESYRKTMLELSERQLEGTCAAVLTRDEWQERGRIDLAPLSRALRDSEITTLSLSFTYPTSAYHQFGGADGAKWRISDGSAHASIDLVPQGGPSVMTVAFGYRPVDLKKAGFIGLAFVVIPMAIMLWMRRIALAKGKDDRVAAWFSYHRTANWCVTAAILLWLFSDFGARQTLGRYLAFRLGETNFVVPLATAALMFVPALMVYTVNVVLAYPVWIHIRQSNWNRREYLMVQLLQGGVTLLPMMFVVAGILLVLEHAQLAMASFAVAYGVFVACSTLRMKVARTFPEALTTGELRDKIFQLAKKAAVPVRQVFVLPAGKGQVANAAAAKNNVVIFTDYLLHKLSKREVNYVAAHELTHLQKHHPRKLTIAFFAAIFAPTWLPWGAQSLLSVVIGVVGAIGAVTRAGGVNWLGIVGAWERGFIAFQQWMFHDLLLIVIGFSGFYLLARQFEFTADAGAIALTGDAEAAITGLVKTHRLNLMPLQWGKVSGAWLTHPATMHRLERIAALGSIGDERLRQLVQESTSASDLTEDAAHYPVPPAPEDEVVSFSGQTSRARFNMWLLVMFHWLPAAATALVVQWQQWQGGTRILAYTCGLAITVALYLFVVRWMIVRRREAVERPLWAKARREGIDVERHSGQTVGISPGPTPRFYVSSYNWETGVLLFASDRLYFLGNQLRFSLTRDQVVDVRLGPGAPNWFGMQRTYLLWRDIEHGGEGSFNLAALGPCRASQARRQLQALYELLARWKRGDVSGTAIPQLADLSSPTLGEVTSISPKALTTPAKSLKMFLLLVLPVSVAGCILLRVQSMSYVALCAFAVRILELIPHWRYHERAVYPLQQPVAAPAQAATAASH